MRVLACYPIYFKDYGIAHACYNIIRYMQSEDAASKVYGLSSDGSFLGNFYQELIPSWSKTIAYKIFSDRQLHYYGETQYLKKIVGGEGCVAYLWPGVSLETYQSLKKHGVTIVYEGVNTHEAHSKVILDEAYQQLGLPISHEITQEKVLLESTKLGLADFVFSCSPIMTSSFLSNGVPPEKILQTSYGLSDKFILDVQPKKNQEVVFTFVGSIGVRKGVHLLLDYWVRAGVKAKLKLVGEIDDTFLSIIKPYLSRHDIEHIPFTNDLPTIYQQTDVFILPSLEEGSPLVTYLALGAGLPIVASPMGAGGVLQHDVQGLIVEPHDTAGWISAIQTLTKDAALRQRLGAEAHKLAKEYKWQNVARKRLNLIQSAMLSVNSEVA